MGISKALYRRRNLVIAVLALFALFLLFRRNDTTTTEAVHRTGANSDNGILRPKVQEPLRDGFIKDPTEYFVQLTLRDNRVVVFSKPGCPHCKAAKELLQMYRDRRALRYIVIEMAKEKDLQGIKHALNSLYQRSTFPSIFVDAQCIGGNAELQNLEDHGRLAQLFEEKGILAKALPEAEKPAKQPTKDNAVEIKVVPPAKTTPTPATQHEAKEKKEKEQEQPSAAELKVRDLVSKHRVMVFSKTYCPYSRRAKQLLSEYRDGRGLDYAVLEADLESDPMAIKAALGSLSGHSTFPNIFVDGKSIGGSDDLARMHRNGELAVLLKGKSLIV
ncbi:hypothetical protein LPJ53_002282 [Coemansia erecta]|uniref:Glutaredoxin domain-containing protein n=1 Tax=Coemansia erecta TaxID=147472 RepID=A0A9W7Y360_9FUNG|nr:hypothetical protein LPJ53_002282 [Coemansia erecta]